MTQTDSRDSDRVQTG